MRRLLTPLAFAIAALSLPPGRAGPPLLEHFLPAPSVPSAADRPSVVREQRYRVNARVRPLYFFWIGRDNIGAGRVTWRLESDGGQAIELLIGSDPARAPRHLNRWGFLRERIDADRADILGLMNARDSATLEEADAAARASNSNVFRALQTTIRRGTATTRTVELTVPQTVTYRELDRVLAVIPQTATTVQTTSLPAGSREGFLLALSDLIRTGSASCREDRRFRFPPPTAAYFFRRSMYDLSLSACRFRPTWRGSDAEVKDVVEARFEIQNRSTGEVTRFDLAFGTSGEFCERPVRVVFRPHWWIEIELVPESASAPAKEGS